MFVQIFLPLVLGLEETLSKRWLTPLANQPELLICCLNIPELKISARTEKHLARKLVVIMSQG